MCVVCQYNLPEIILSISKITYYLATHIQIYKGEAYSTCVLSSQTDLCHFHPDTERGVCDDTNVSPELLFGLRNMICGLSVVGKEIYVGWMSKYGVWRA